MYCHPTICTGTTDCPTCYDIDGYMNKNAMKPIPFPDCKPQQASICSKKQEKQMHNNHNAIAALTVAPSAPPIEMLQRDYLLERLEKVWEDKKHESKIKFGLENRNRPRTLNDFVNRIKSDQFTISNSEELGDYEMGYYSIFEYFEWRDPSIKKDRAGYDAWKKAEQVKVNGVIDIIKIKSLDDGLAALQAFEASEKKTTKH